MILRVAEKHRCRLSNVGILSDHQHILLGLPFECSPLDIALSYLNNLAYVQRMKPLYQYGGFIGAVGEYTNKVF